MFCEQFVGANVTETLNVHITDPFSRESTAGFPSPMTSNVENIVILGPEDQLW